MIANIAPSVSSYEDTYNTLIYADRAKNIKTNALKNEQNVKFHVSQYKTVIADLRLQLEEAKTREAEITKPQLSMLMLLKNYSWLFLTFQLNHNETKLSLSKRRLRVWQYKEKTQRTILRDGIRMLSAHWTILLLLIKNLIPFYTIWTELVSNSSFHTFCILHYFFNFSATITKNLQFEIDVLPTSLDKELISRDYYSHLLEFQRTESLIIMHSKNIFIQQLLKTQNESNIEGTLYFCFVFAQKINSLRSYYVKKNDRKNRKERKYIFT